MAYRTMIQPLSRRFLQCFQVAECQKCTHELYKPFLLYPEPNAWHQQIPRSRQALLRWASIFHVYACREVVVSEIILFTSSSISCFHRQVTGKLRLPLIENCQPVFLLCVPFHGIVPILPNRNILRILAKALLYVLPELSYVITVIDLKNMMPGRL